MSVSEKTVSLCAKSMVETCNLRRGDAVIVRGGAHTQLLLEEIALECFRKGATPTMLITSDRYLKKVYEEIPAKHLEITPKHYLAMVKHADLLISVEEMEDPTIASRFPREKMLARERANSPIRDVIFHKTKGKKWLYAGWPTPKSAKAYGIPYADLESTILRGIATPPEQLMKTGSGLAKKLKGASWLHVWHANGTDFRLKVADRRITIDDGFTSQEDVESGDGGANLPAGELFIAPHETEGQGTMICPVTSDQATGTIIRDIRLEFENGELKLDKVTARKGLKELLQSFQQSEKVDRERYKTVRTKNVAELGIGFNPNIKRAIGYILTDEKVNGTIHLAFGSNNTYGGTSQSSMHWDFVSEPGVSIEVERLDGSKALVMDEGKFV